MELQKIKESLDSLRTRYLVCRFNRAFLSNEFIQVVLDVISDEAEIVETLVAENPEIFDHQSRTTVCYVKSTYFEDFLEKDDPVLYEQYQDADYSDQQDLLCEYLKNKIIIVRPYFYYNEYKGQFYKNGTIVDIIEVNYEPSRFLTIPIIPMASYEKFDRDDNFALPSVSNSIVGKPEYLFYQNEFYKVSVKPLESNDCYWHNEEEKTKIILDVNKLAEEGKLIYNFGDACPFVFILKDSLLSYKKPSKKIESTKSKENEDDPQEFEDSEKGQILRDFSNFARSNNLCYNINDIYNFYTCICSSQLIILAGMSGTGKTKLPMKFAEYFNMTEDDNTLLFVPVSPSFTEPADILGYLNTNTGLYSSSETRLIEFLKHAMENEDKMHMIIFDEMNLSQIEYWFAPFVSILEKDLGDRKLHLYSKFQRCINDEKYPSSIKIGNNVIFVGTINLDETTKNISDRLLDRSYIINLKKETFMNYQAQQSDIQENVKPFDGDFKKLMPKESDYKKNYIETFTTKELEFFDKIHHELNKVDSQKGVSFRSVKNISLFINNKPKELSRQQAFDYAFKQTVMKKINGSIDSIGKFIGTDINEDGEANGVLTDIFNSYSEISEFKECRAEIKNKVLELKKYGYAR